MPSEVEVSFVMPCLNEEETLAACIESTQACIEESGLDAEIVIADNGSTDRSAEIARALGARVVHVPDKGYGSALMGGFENARGRFLVMGDADGSYDFAQAVPMVEKLRSGADLVMGSRFLGKIEPGAMPWSHRYIGNPVLSFIGRLLFPSPISDFHCGLRALSKKAYGEMNLRTTGMEFASEMVVKATARDMRVEEVPITLRPDGRSRPPHLRTWRDGWRHLRFLMTLSPRWTLFVPGLILLLFGTALLIPLGLGPVQLRAVTFDIHTMLVASLLMIVGYQGVTTAIAARIYAFEEELGPPAPWMQRAFEIFTLDRGIVAGVVLALAGSGLIGKLAWDWAASGFGPLEPAVTLRPVVVGATLVALGIQTLLMSFVYSMLGIKRRRDR